MVTKPESRADQLRWLAAKLRDEIASDETPRTAVPGLAREYRTALAELEQIEPTGAKTPGDDLAERRKRRRESAAKKAQ